ncbi:MAG TPA: pyridoxamine 5'-phosphate oxidase family protein [Thermomicrobiales bacterium]|nr:pyridoxamine 5'-phosphate oxidase family protein [Thermomicrobiales bacterium]
MGVIRNLPADQIEILLQEALVYRIACTHPDEPRPYLVPIALAYDGMNLVGHTGHGTKLRAMRANPLVVIEVDRADASDIWESVVCQGTFRELGGVDRESALHRLYPVQRDFPDLGEMTVVFEIEITKKTGRYERPT